MAVIHLSTNISDSSPLHWEQAKRVLRYLKGAADFALMYGSAPSSKMEGCSYLDYASDVDGRRSRTEYVFMLNGATVNWKSRRKQILALSTAGAQYMAMTAAA
jgi:hypothetical protein